MSKQTILNKRTSTKEKVATSGMSEYGEILVNYHKESPRLVIRTHKDGDSYDEMAYFVDKKYVDSGITSAITYFNEELENVVSVDDGDTLGDGKIVVGNGGQLVREGDVSASDIITSITLSGETGLVSGTSVGHNLTILLPRGSQGLAGPQGYIGAQGPRGAQGRAGAVRADPGGKH